MGPTKSVELVSKRALLRVTTSEGNGYHMNIQR